MSEKNGNADERRTSISGRGRRRISTLDRRVASDTKDDTEARATTAAGTVPELNAVKYTVESVAKCHQANQ